MPRKRVKKEEVVDESESDNDESEDEEKPKKSSKRKISPKHEESESDDDNVVIEDEDNGSPKTKKKLGKKAASISLTDIEDFPGHPKTYHSFSSASEIDSIRSNLLTWFDNNKRDLPWRFPDQIAQDTDENNNIGYSVWVSEIMLQQTRVQTVIDYFTRWIKKWPTIADLASTTLEEVNEMWSGLGYYRRAKFLYEGAKLLVEKYDGKLPKTAKELQDIPGIGKYTAGAIASIAFGEVTPLVDGNVIRVLSRLRSIGADPKNSSIVKLHWQLAEKLVDVKRPGSFNQSLMELGATVCTAQSPDCEKCPVRNYCNAYKEVKQKIKREKECAICGEMGVTESVTKYPCKVKKNAQRPESVATVLVENDKGEFLLVQRPSTGLLASLWEFPQVSIGQETELAKGLKKEQLEQLEDYLKNTLGLARYETNTKSYLGHVTHLFSHIKQTMYVQYMSIDLKKESKSKLAIKWLKESEIPSAAICKTVHKCLELKNKPKKTKSTPEKKRAKKVDSKQPSIAGFFKKS